MMTICGYKRNEFVAKDTGALIGGYTIYVTEERKNVVGHAVDSFFVSDGCLARSDLGASDLMVDEPVEILYNKYGKIATIKLG